MYRALNIFISHLKFNQLKNNFIYFIDANDPRESYHDFASSRRFNLNCLLSNNVIHEKQGVV